MGQTETEGWFKHNEMQDIHAPMAGSALMDYAGSKDNAEIKHVYTTSKLYED